jgi:phytoene desaturase
MKTPRVVVIGAGIGGITAAAKLAKHGYTVQVFEKNEIPGGRCGYIEVQGHRFDTGPTLFLMPDLYEQAFSALGENIEDHLDLIRIDPTYQIHFADGLNLVLSSDLNQMHSQLEAIEPGCFNKYLDYLGEGFRHYQLSLPNIVTKGFYTPLSFFNAKNLRLLVQLKALKNHHRNMAKYFQDERLKFSFLFQNLYMGLNPFKAPAIYSLMPYTELVNGVYFPKGGMYSVTHALVKIAESHGVSISYDSPVKCIQLNNNRASGVKLEDGRMIEADIVIANADLPYVYQSLLPKSRTSKVLARKKYGCSAMVFFWGLDKQYSQLGPHNLFLAEDLRGGFEQIFKYLSLSAQPSFYVHAPVRIDNSLAPKGHDTLVIAVPVPHINESNPQDWEKFRLQSRTYIIQRLAAIGVDNIEDHIKFEFTFAPEDWEKRYNLSKGSAHGLGHDLLQMGYMRPTNRHKDYRNLYFVGASTHPGTGLPSVLTSARLVSERIMEEVGR